MQRLLVATLLIAAFAANGTMAGLFGLGANDKPCPILSLYEESCQSCAAETGQSEATLMSLVGKVLSDPDADIEVSDEELNFMECLLTYMGFVYRDENGELQMADESDIMDTLMVQGGPMMTTEFLDKLENEMKPCEDYIDDDALLVACGLRAIDRACDTNIADGLGIEGF